MFTKINNSNFETNFVNSAQEFESLKSKWNELSYKEKNACTNFIHEMDNKYGKGKHDYTIPEMIEDRIFTDKQIKDFCKNRGENYRFKEILFDGKKYYGIMKSGNWYEIDINEELEEAIPTKVKNEEKLKELNMGLKDFFPDL